MSAVISAPRPPSISPPSRARQQAAWSAGDYAVVGTTLQIVGESLCEALDLRAGERVLDVAAGNGNATLAAARRWCDVDLDRLRPGAARAPGARGRRPKAMPVQFQQADAENLPFADAQFDVVMSTFGVMFTPDQEKAAASWRASASRAAGSAWRTGRRRASSASCSRLIGKYMPAGGRREVARALGHRSAAAASCSAAGATRSHIHSRDFVFRYRSPATGSRSSAPTTARCTRRSARWTPTKQAALAADLLALMAAATARATARWCCPASTSKW